MLLFVVSLSFVIVINVYELNLLSGEEPKCLFIAILAKISILIVSFIVGIVLALHLFDREVNFEHMTGLCSRKKLFVDLNNLIKRKAPFTVCYIDFNDFKIVNDKYGHAAGDMLIREFANRIVNLKCKKIIGYRIGGDEFVIIITNKLDVQSCIESIWKIADDDVKITSKEYIKISFAMGTAENDFISNADQILRKSDCNMYKNKRT